MARGQGAGLHVRLPLSPDRPSGTPSVDRLAVVGLRMGVHQERVRVSRASSPSGNRYLFSTSLGFVEPSTTVIRCLELSMLLIICYPTHVS